MRLEIVVDTYDIGMWFRRRWTRLLIRLHLREPLPPWSQRFGTIDFTWALYDLSPSEVPFLTPTDVDD